MNVRSWENFQRKLADQRQFVLKRFNYDMERTKENEDVYKRQSLHRPRSGIENLAGQIPDGPFRRAGCVHLSLIHI